MTKKKAKTKKIVKPVLKLEGKLLEKVIIYNNFNQQKKDSENELKPLKKIIIKILNELNFTKAKSQIYNVNLNHIEEEKVSTKKLKEELVARGLKELWNSCLYKSKYDRLTITKRKGGENIF